MVLLRRTIKAVTVILGLLIAGIAGALWLTLPPARQVLDIPGLTAPVEVTFDQDGVPRIHASSFIDAVAALGYVHARDRMFEMDIMRRVVSGRVAEIAGPAAVASDMFMRRLGPRRAALADLAGLGAETRDLLAAYANGVNAWITSRGRFASAESLVFGSPERWEPVDGLLWAKLMGLYLSSNFRTELARLALAKTLPPERIAELWPPDHGAGRPQASLDTRYADAAAAVLRAMPAFPQPFTLPETASNEWAVDGAHSATGAPLLAGDPHRAFSMPGIWYLVRIDLPDETLAGATAPGAPFLVIGHNAHIAWTFTTTGADVQDVFEETQVDSAHYLGPAGPLSYETREERIHVRGGADARLLVLSTRHGPVISDGMTGEGRVLALSMANLAPDDTAATGLLALNRARTVAEAGAAAALISAPVQNLLVADRQHIGLFVTGRIPIRRSGDGSAPVSGADGAHDWLGFASGAQLPHIVAPDSGHLVNANDRIAPDDFPVFLGRDAFGDWRARRIRTLLQELPRPTTADFVAMQTDVVSAYAQQLLPALRKVAPSDPLAAQALALLGTWDGTIRQDAPQALIFNAWLAKFHDAVLAAHGLGANGVPVGAASPSAEFTAFVVAGAETSVGKWWCGQACDALLSQTLSAAMADLAQRFGAEPALWRWGVAHHAVFANQALQAVPILGPLTTAEVAIGGDDSTVGRAGMAAGSFDAVHGAAYRGVYDMSDLDHSLFMIAPGQSGNPVSRHSRDLIGPWQKGQAIALGPVADRVAATLSLRPPLLRPGPD
jgi:penicillin amidase